MGEGGRLGSGVSIHDVAEAERGALEGEEESRQKWVAMESGRDSGGTAGVVAVVGRDENLMSLSCSSGDGRLTGSISQSWSRLLVTVRVKKGGNSNLPVTNLYKLSFGHIAL